MNCTQQNKITVKKARKSTKLFFSMNLLMNNLASPTCLYKNVTVTRETWGRETDWMKPVLIQVVPFNVTCSVKFVTLLCFETNIRAPHNLLFSSMWLHFYTRYNLSVSHFCLSFSSTHKQVQNTSYLSVMSYCQTDEYILYIIPSCICGVGHTYF